MPRRPPPSVPSSAFSSISGEQRQALQAAFNHGLSANAAQAALSAAGIGLRRTTVQAAYREIGGIRFATRAFNQTPFDFRPSAGAFTKVAFGLADNFRIHGYVNAVNIETGKVETVYAYASSSENLSRAQWLEAMASSLAQVIESRHLSFATTEIVVTEALTIL